MTWRICVRLKSWKGAQLIELCRLSRAGWSAYTSSSTSGMCVGQILLLQSDGEAEEVEILVDRFFKSKRRDWLIIRLKAMECYQGLLCYLSFYINLLMSYLFRSRLLIQTFDTTDDVSFILHISHPIPVGGGCDRNRNRFWYYLSGLGIVLTIPSDYPFWSTSGPRRDSPPWWITHLHPTIHQDPSAYIEPRDHLELRLNLLTSAASTTQGRRTSTTQRKLGKSWCWRSKNQSSQPSFSPLHL